MKRSLTEIFLARLSYGARRRVCPKSFVIGSAIVVARYSKAARRPEYEQRCRNPGRHPSWFCAKPTLIGIAEKLRRVERRQIWPEPEVLTLESCPCSVNDERRKPEKNS